MTGDPSKHRVRPTEEVLRQRLIARRSDYERTRGEAGLGGRLNQRGTANQWAPGAEIPAGQRLRSFVTRRPVTAYLSMATIAGLAFGGLALTLSGTGETAAPVQVAESRQTASPASGQAAVAHDATDQPVADIGTEAASGIPATALRDQVAATAVPASPAAPETATRLRPASEDLPASIATQETRITDEAAAALALRLPPADDTLAMAEVPDRLLTTGSVLAPAEPGDAASGTSQPLVGDDQPSEDAGSLAASGADTGPSPADEAAAEEEVAALGEPDAAGRAATVNASVNMRESPDNDASILAVLPQGSAVAVIACDMWCEVAADGKRGYVFSRFVDGADG